MVEWLAKYWLEVLFAAVLGIITWGGKRLIHFYINQLKQMLEETQEAILEIVNTKDQEQDKKMDELRAGLLSLQGPLFKERCHNLLEPDHRIEVEELERITRDHEAYKGLGGNHEGDTLFDLVKEKAKKVGENPFMPGPPGRNRNNNRQGAGAAGQGRPGAAGAGAGAGRPGAGAAGGGRPMGGGR